MPFQRVWDESCPRVYDRWEADGKSWVIQDLRPEDDAKALELLLDNMSKDEVLCGAVGLAEDEESMREMGEFWKVCLAQRMTLGCYVVTAQGQELVALNCCIVYCRGEHEELYPIRGKRWQEVYGALSHVESKADSFEYLGLDTLLYAVGLVVRSDCRGARLGARILQARIPLALSQGIKGTSTVFTGPASQRSAERAGFTELARCSLTELAGIFPRYPEDDDRVIKLMVKKFE